MFKTKKSIGKGMAFLLAMAFTFTVITAGTATFCILRRYWKVPVI